MRKATLNNRLSVNRRSSRGSHSDDHLRGCSHLITYRIHMLAYEALGEPRSDVQLGEIKDTVIIIIETILDWSCYSLEPGPTPHFEFQNHRDGQGAAQVTPHQ